MKSKYVLRYKLKGSGEVKYSSDYDDPDGAKSLAWLIKNAATDFEIITMGEVASEPYDPYSDEG